MAKYEMDAFDISKKWDKMRYAQKLLYFVERRIIETPDFAIKLPAQACIRAAKAQSFNEGFNICLGYAEMIENSEHFV